MIPTTLYSNTGTMAWAPNNTRTMAPSNTGTTGWTTYGIAPNTMALPWAPPEFWMDKSNPYYNYYLIRHTFCKLRNPAHRYIWAGYLGLIVLMSIVGDGTILISSCRYKAIKLHKLLVVIIEFMALSDLIFSLVIILPRIPPLVTNEWAFRDLRVCYFLGYGRYILQSISGINVCLITGLKLMILKFPFRAANWSKKAAVIACAVNVATSFSTVVVVAYHNRRRLSTYFNYSQYICHANDENFPKIIFVIHLILIPIFVMFCSSWLLLLACKIAKSRRTSQTVTTLKWQGLTATLSLAIIYCITNWGVYIYILNRTNFDEDPQNIYMRVAENIHYLNIINNIFIYIMTISSFREFLWSCLKKWCLSLRKWCLSLRRCCLFSEPSLEQDMINTRPQREMVEREAKVRPTPANVIMNTEV